jgi:hypothetical protein
MYYPILVLLLATLSISRVSPNAAVGKKLVYHSGNHEAKSDSVKYAVLPISKLRSRDFFKGRTDASLNRNDFSKIDKLVHGAVQVYNDKQKSVYKSWLKKLPGSNIYKEQFFINLPKYRRQYFCSLNDKGEKIVWVNCFCGTKDYWKTSEVFVFDGGNCYFHMMINISTGQVSEFGINGVA